MYVLLTEDYPPKSGGMATWTYEIAQAFEQMKRPVVVYTRRKGDTSRTDGNGVHHMGGRNWPLFRDVYLLWYVVQIARLYPGCTLYACNALLGFVPDAQ